MLETKYFIVSEEKERKWKFAWKLFVNSQKTKNTFLQKMCSKNIENGIIEKWKSLEKILSDLKKRKEKKI